MSIPSVPAFPVFGVSVTFDWMVVSDEKADDLDAPVANELASSEVSMPSVYLRRYIYRDVRIFFK